MYVTIVFSLYYVVLTTSTAATQSSSSHSEEMPADDGRRTYGAISEVHTACSVGLVGPWAPSPLVAIQRALQATRQCESHSP